MKQRNPFYLPIVIIIAILSVSTASLFIRLAQKEAPSIVIAAFRLTLSSLIIAPYALSKYKVEIKSLIINEYVLILLSGIFLAIHFAVWITSLEYTSVTSSVVLVSTSPLWVEIVSPIFLREKITRSIFIGSIITFLGVTILALSDSCSWRSGFYCPSFIPLIQGKALFGDLLSLAGAITVSGYLLIGRKLREKASLLPYIFLVYSVAAILLIGYMILIGETPQGYSPQIYFWIFLLALIPQTIGHSSYNWLLKFLRAGAVAVITLGEPIGATILAILVFHEIPGILKIGGVIVLLIGILVSLRDHN